MESSDFSFLSTNLTFLRGSADSTLECVSISITDDALLEGNQTFTVTLSTSDPDVLLGNNVTVITIKDTEGESYKEQSQIFHYTLLVLIPRL